MTNFVGNCDPKIQPGVLANGGRLLPVAGGREISEAQQVAVRQVVRADVVSEKNISPEYPSRLFLSLVFVEIIFKKKIKKNEGSPRDKDTYVEVIRVIRVLGVQLVGPGSETGQCIFGVGTNGQIYLRENHFEMEWNHFGNVANLLISTRIIISMICEIFVSSRISKFIFLYIFLLRKIIIEGNSIGN